MIAAASFVGSECCLVADLPCEIGAMVSLTLLDISGNVLTSLPVEIVRLSKLVALNIR